MQKLWNVVLGFSRLSIPIKIDTALFVHDMMDGNEYFTHPMPSLNRVYDAAQELNMLYIKARNGTKEDTVLMRQKERALDVLVKILGNYVEIVALDNNAIGDVIINSAGFNLKQFAGGVKRTFVVENTAVAGKIVGHAKVITGAAYQWEKSADGVNYTIIASTDRSTIVLNGFEPGSKVYIRVAPVLKGERYAYQGPAILYIT